MINRSVFASVGRVSGLVTPQFPSKYGSILLRGYTSNPKPQIPQQGPTTITLQKRDIPQSPLKMRFLVSLIRDTWVPDALAQLKFSPKLRAFDVGKVVKRGVSFAGAHYSLLPEQLYVKQVFVTKGDLIRRVRIMGRGRHGVAIRRKSNLNVTLEEIDFEARIRDAKTAGEKKRWSTRKDLVQTLWEKKKGQTLTVSAPTPGSA